MKFKLAKLLISLYFFVMVIGELENELSRLEGTLGRLQAEVMQSNGILDRVKIRELQKRHELNTLSQQLASIQETLVKPICNLLRLNSNFLEIDKN